MVIVLRRREAAGGRITTLCRQVKGAIREAGIDPAYGHAGQRVAPGRTEILQKAVSALSHGGAVITANGVELIKKPRRSSQSAKSQSGNPKKTWKSPA